MDSYMLAGIVLIACVAVLHMLVVRYELPGRFFRVGWHNDIWCIHHDEKILIPDARAYHLGRRMGARLENYSPPVSMAFGAVGPLLVTLGFRLWGLTNKGLRLPGQAIHMVSWSCLLFIAREIVGPGWALVFLTFWLVNDNTFVLQHHFILEHIHGATLLLLWVAYALFPEWCVDNPFLMGFLVSSLVLVKINFLVLTQAFLVVLVMSYGSLNPRMLFWTVVGGGAGVVVFEILHWLFLRRFADYRIRVRNFCDALWIHGGGKHDYLQKHWAPSGVTIFCRANLIILDWFVGTSLRTKPDSTMGKIVGWGLAPLLIAGLFIGRGGTMAIVLAVYLFIAMLIHVPFAFYMKRLTAYLPLCLLSAVAGFKGWIGLLPDIAGQIVQAVFLVFLAGYCLVQLQKIWSGIRRRSTRVEDNSRELERIVEPGRRVYMHCYAFRFLWMARDMVLFGADDQYKNNAMAYESALRMGADYVVLSSGRTGLTGHSEFPGIQLGQLETESLESDFPDGYVILDLRSVEKESVQYSSGGW